MCQKLNKNKILACIKYFNKWSYRDGSGLGAFIALTEDLSSVPTTPIWWLITISNPPCNLMPSSGLREHQAYTWCPYMSVEKTLIHIKVKK